MAKAPNILIIWGDDIGVSNLSCYSDGVMGYRTPHIDRIAAEGARFTSAYTTAPSCTPARDGLLTGLSPWRHGMLGYGRVAER